MKNLLLTAIALCLGITISMAQDRTQKRQLASPEERAQQMIKHLDKELKLTAEQKDSLTVWSIAFGKKQQELFKNKGESREAKMEKMKATRDAQSAKIKTILTPEQITKYDELSQRMQERKPVRSKQ